MAHAFRTAVVIAQPSDGPPLCLNVQRPDRLVQLNTSDDLSRWIGCDADSLTADEIAAALATRAWQQRDDANDGLRDRAGIGCQVSADASGARTTVVVHTSSRTELLHWQVSLGEDARSVDVSSRILERIVAAAECGAPVDPRSVAVGDVAIRHRRAEPPEPIHQLVVGDVELVWCPRPGEPTHGRPTDVGAVLSGAFNPLHKGHMALREAAATFLGVQTAYELPIVNADKPPLDYLALDGRMRQFVDAPVVLSRAATFVEKARLMPRITFVVGFDTALRILNPRYYGGHDAMQEALHQIRQAGSSFLVAGRVCGGRFQTLADLRCPPGQSDLFKELPVDRFRVDLSSTDVRRSR